MMYNTRSRNTPAGIHLIRIVLAVVFLVSGFLKAVDPWGSALQIDEYLSAFGMEWLSGARYVLSIGQSALEIWLGLLLLFNQLRTFSRFLVMLLMLGFTVLTLFIALTDPVQDCGCFGEAIKLTHWQTFFKNLVLLPLSVILFGHTRKEIVTESPRHGLVVLSLILALFPGITAMYSLPWIDFLPYKVGANISALTYVAPEDRGETRTTLFYRNLETDETVEFEVSDTTWYDQTRWEFVDTWTVVISEGKKPAVDNFVIFDRQQDVTREILDAPEIFLLTADRLDGVTEKEAERFARTYRFAQSKGIRAVCLTAGSLDGEADFQRRTGVPIPCYNIDATTLKTLLRAQKGLVILEKGTIIAKKNLRRVPDFGKSGAGSGLEYVLGKQRACNERTFVIIYGLLILVLLFGRYSSCKN